MRDLHDVRVLRGVSHVLAPRNPALLLVLSEAELPLGQGVGDILVSHVEGGLGDPQAKAAVFAAGNQSGASRSCTRILGARPPLIALTQQLASSLYAIIERDKRVTDGTLAVLLCEALTATGTPFRFVAMLKLDPSAKLRTVTDLDPASGKRRVRYEVDSATLPSKNEKIQKCAFVRSFDPGSEYEMLVVDRQRRASIVSDFWVGGFLGARFVLDAPERTKRLYRGLHNGRNKVENKLDSSELAALDQIISGTILQTSVNVDDLVSALPVSESIRAEINAEVSDLLPDREFDLDREVADQFLRRRTYIGDNDLRLSVLTAYSQVIHVEDIDSGDQNNRLRRVSFETRTWQES
jgi:hypothetical protein